MYLVKYHLTSGPKDSLGVIQAEGRAKDDDEVRQLKANLAEAGIKVIPTKNGVSPDSDYPIQFTLDLELPVPKPPQAKPVPAPQS
jgi:hypothetical protein